MLTGRLALYTTVYPGVERYLPAWYKSVSAQTDCNFDIWIGVDGLAVDAVIEAMGADPSATWVMAEAGDTPAQIRQAAIEKIAHEYPAVVFVDSDDLLEPTRVGAARKSLRSKDISACAMRIIDERGTDLGIVSKPSTRNVVALIPRYNVFGLTNTAYRSQILRQCLPIPAECVLIDWFLVTRAWALDASLGFDFTCRMAYRQHSYSIANVLAPFTKQQVLQASKLVLSHYNIILVKVPQLQTEHKKELETARQRAKAFCNSVTESPEMLDCYVHELNRLPLNHIWWECVAHPQLEYIWRRN